MAKKKKKAPHAGESSKDRKGAIEARVRARRVAPGEVPIAGKTPDGASIEMGAPDDLLIEADGPEDPSILGQMLYATAEPDGGSFGVVGIGASAAGLASLTELLGNLPVDAGLAYVIVQHLDSQQDSELASLLSKATQLPVVEVTQGTILAPDRVYILPPSTTMLLVEGRLLFESRPPHGQYMPIDLFLRSLAMERRSKAVGVLLSGTGTDGTLGMQAVKAEGGFTFAESEQSARLPQMLLSAVGNGAVDLILSAAEIGHELGLLGKRIRMAGADVAAVLDGDPEKQSDLRKIFSLLRNVKDVDFTYYRQTTIKRRILRRMLLHKIRSVREYLTLLRERPAEIEGLYQDILIRVTSFFRDPEMFDKLKEKVFPVMIGRKRPQDAPIRVWVPGCATGEEAYSIAICLSEYLLEQRLRCPIQLFGTDVNDAALEKARAGVYLENIALDVTPERLRRWFGRSGTTYQISQSIRDFCLFARQNVASDPPFSKLDLISCRNVLIYLAPVLQKKVLPTFHYALKPGGYLVLGSSETAGNTSELFEPVDRQLKIYSKAPGTVRLGLDFPYFHTAGRGSVERAPERTEETEAYSLHREADTLALARYAPPGVIINEEMQILEFRGQTGPYLAPAPGEPSHHLMKMAREGLPFELRSLIHQALKTGQAVRSGRMQVRSEGSLREVYVEIAPLRGGWREGADRPGGRYFLVSFEEQRPATPPPEDHKTGHYPMGAGTTTEGREGEQLKQELAATREYLHAIIDEMEATNEELQSANEEILSSNEELQSINEELETAKEELQSTNEELTTVNEELQSRNAELTQTNNDLYNTLSSVNVPILILSADLRIRRFTPAAEKVLHLIPSDAGRLIGDTRHGLDIPDLEQLLGGVIEGMKSFTRDVQDSEGRWYSMRVCPYRTTDNQVEGAVLILVDIDESKRALEALEALGALHQLTEALLGTVHEPLLVLDGALRVRQANESFYEMFRLTREQAGGKYIYDLSETLNVPSLRLLLEEVLPKNPVLRDYRVEHDLPEIGPKVFLLNARQVRREQGPTDHIVLAFRDVTSQPG